MGYRATLNRSVKFEVFTGAENLFDAKYSLGNDVNGFGGRYYNAAAGRNYFAGISLQYQREN
jgi:iron complex outermembrane receptor protein